MGRICICGAACEVALGSGPAYASFSAPHAAPTHPVRLACLPLCRYHHAARLLRSNAATLEHIKLHHTSIWDVEELLEGFEEALPRELPACTDLDLGGLAITPYTLLSLASCSLPAVERLSLCLREERSEWQQPPAITRQPLAPADDFAWAAQLPRLRELRLEGLRRRADFEAVEGMLLAAGSHAGLVTHDGFEEDDVDVCDCDDEDEDV